MNSPISLSDPYRVSSCSLRFHWLLLARHHPILPENPIKCTCNWSPYELISKLLSIPHLHLFEIAASMLWCSFQRHAAVQRTFASHGTYPIRLHKQHGSKLLHLGYDSCCQVLAVPDHRSRAPLGQLPSDSPGFYSVVFCTVSRPTIATFVKEISLDNSVIRLMSNYYKSFLECDTYSLGV